MDLASMDLYILKSEETVEVLHYYEIVKDPLDTTDQLVLINCEEDPPEAPLPKFECEIENCNKSYTTKNHLKIHQRIHTNTKPYQCQYCEKSFTTSYSFKTHQRVHTGEKPYGCQDCTKSFKSSGDLLKHTRTHTGTKPYACPYEGCNKSFTTTNIRKIHVRVHTGERPYNCLQCGKTFVSPTNFNNHKRIHTGEKPFVCEVEDCNKGFTEYSSLYKHRIVHKQKICEFCSKSFRQNAALTHHLQNIHKVENIDDLVKEEVS